MYIYMYIYTYMYIYIIRIQTKCALCIQIFQMCVSVWRNKGKGETRMCDMTKFIFVTCFIHMCNFADVHV